MSRGTEGEYFATIGEKIKKAAEKNPEKFPFVPGDQVWVRDSKTGEMEDWFFAGWDTGTGKALVSKIEGMLKLVDRDDLLKPSKTKKGRN